MGDVVTNVKNIGGRRGSGMAKKTTDDLVAVLGRTATPLEEFIAIH